MRIPEKVTHTFNSLYPHIDADNISWSWSLPGKLYLATFVEDEEIIEAEITITGHHLCTVRSIDPESVPGAVLDTVSDDFRGFALEGIEEVTFSDGTVLYEAGFLAINDEIDEEEEEEPIEEEEEPEEETEDDVDDIAAEDEEYEETVYGEYFEVYITAEGDVLMEEEEETA